MHYATSWKVAGSRPDKVIAFLSIYLNLRTALDPGVSQPLSEISTRNIKKVSWE
jgi:hypothetical protein